MARTKLAVLFSIVALLTFFDVTHGAARAFSKDGKEVAMKNFRSLNIGIQWDRWLVNLAGASTDCSDVGRQGPVIITKRSRTPDGQSFAGYVDSTPGDHKDADSVTKYINTVISAWPSRYDMRSQIEQARNVGCAVRPGCRRNALIVCVFSPAVDGSGSAGRQPLDRYNQPGHERPDDRFSIQPVDPRREQPVDPRYNPAPKVEDTFRIQPVDPRYQPGREQPDDRYSNQPVDPRYNQPGREEDTARIPPVGPRYNNQPGRERPDDRYSNQPVDPRYNQPGREEDTARIPPVGPRYNNQPGREQPDDRYSNQPVDPRYQPGDREEDTFRIQPFDPRYNNQPGREEDRHSIQPVDPRNQPDREQPDDRYSIQPVDSRYANQPTGREEDAFRIPPVVPRYNNQPTDPRYRNQPSDQFESRGTYGRSQPSPYSTDRRTVNYPGGRVTFEKVDDPQTGHSHSSLSRKEMRRRRKEEKRLRQETRREEEVDIYDRMINDGMMMGDDPNAQLGNLNQNEFMDYRQKYDASRLPRYPQHLKKADGVMIEVPREKLKEIESQQKEIEVQREMHAEGQRGREDVFRTQDNVKTMAEKSNFTTEKADVVEGRNRGSRDVEVIERLPQRLVIDENPERVAEPDGEKRKDGMLNDAMPKVLLQADDESAKSRWRRMSVASLEKQRRDPRYYGPTGSLDSLQSGRRQHPNTARQQGDKRRQLVGSDNQQQRQSQSASERYYERYPEAQRPQTDRIGQPEIAPHQNDRRRQNEQYERQQRQLEEYYKRYPARRPQERNQTDQRRQPEIASQNDRRRQNEQYERQLEEYYERYPGARRPQERNQTDQRRQPEIASQQNDRRQQNEQYKRQLEEYYKKYPGARRPRPQPRIQSTPTPYRPIPVNYPDPRQSQTERRDQVPYLYPYTPPSRLSVQAAGPKAFTEEQRIEVERALDKKWDRTYFLENLSGMEASCKMLVLQDRWPFQEARNEGSKKGYDVRGFLAVTPNRGSTPDALRIAINNMRSDIALYPDNSLIGCSLIPDCNDRNIRMQVVVVCLLRVETRQF